MRSQLWWWSQREHILYCLCHHSVGCKKLQSWGLRELSAIFVQKFCRERDLSCVRVMMKEHRKCFDKGQQRFKRVWYRQTLQKIQKHQVGCETFETLHWFEKLMSAHKVPLKYVVFWGDLWTLKSGDINKIHLRGQRTTFVLLLAPKKFL